MSVTRDNYHRKKTELLNDYIAKAHEISQTYNIDYITFERQERLWLRPTPEMKPTYKRFLDDYGNDRNAVIIYVLGQSDNELYKNLAQYAPNLVGVDLLYSNRDIFVFYIDGLRDYLENRAEIVAMKETGYNPKRLPLGLIASWVAQAWFAIITAPFTFGTSIAFGAMNLIQDITNAMNSNNAQAMIGALNNLANAVKFSNNLVQVGFSSQIAQAKAMQEIHAIYSNNPFRSYEIYASGALYTQGAAGSQSYQPSQPYNPSKHIAGTSIDRNQAIDEYTQGRSHYLKAGNDGAFIGLNPSVYLAKASSQTILPNFHLEHIALIQGLIKLSEITLAGKNAENHQSGYGLHENLEDYLNALYVYNYGKKLERYLGLLNKEEMLENAKHYPKAIKGMIECNFAKRLKALQEVPQMKFIEITKDTAKTTELKEFLKKNILERLNQSGGDPSVNHALVYGAPRESEQQKREREQRLRTEFYTLIGNSQTLGVELKATMLLQDYRNRLRGDTITELERLKGKGAWLLHEVLLESGGKIELRESDFYTKAQREAELRRICKGVMSVFSDDLNRFVATKLQCDDFECNHRYNPYPAKSKLYELLRYFLPLGIKSGIMMHIDPHRPYDTRAIDYAKAIDLALYHYEYPKGESDEGQAWDSMEVERTLPIFYNRWEKPSTQAVLEFLYADTNIAGEFLAVAGRKWAEKGFD